MPSDPQATNHRLQAVTMKYMKSMKGTTERPNRFLAETRRSPRTPRSTDREKQEGWTEHRERLDRRDRRGKQEA